MTKHFAPSESLAPVELSSAAKQRLVASSREFWEPRAGRPISDENAREIASNIVGFFDLLAKWDRQDRDKK